MAGNFLRRTGNRLSEVQERAAAIARDPFTKDVVGNLIGAAKEGAVDVISRGDGRVSKLDITRAALRPHKTLRRMAIGVGGEVAGSAVSMARDPEMRHDARKLVTTSPQVGRTEAPSPFDDPFGAEATTRNPFDIDTPVVRSATPKSSLRDRLSRRDKAEVSDPAPQASFTDTPPPLPPTNDLPF